MAERVKLDSEIMYNLSDTVLVENRKLTRIQQTLEKSTTSVQKHNALAESLLDIGEIQVRRISRASSLIEAVEQKLFNEGAYEDLSAKDLASLFRTMREDLVVSAQLVQNVVKTVDPEKLDRSIAMQAALDITPEESTRRTVSIDMQEEAGEILRGIIATDE